MNAQNPCPACGSATHDGWVNRDGCPEDWTFYTGFMARRQLQLAAEAAFDESGGGSGVNPNE